MSGVYIHGMEMPESCWRCEIGNAEQMDNRPCPFYSIDGEEQKKYADLRHPDCPLVPVPEHGRLGDLDALMQKDNDDYDIALLLTTDDEIQSVITRLHIQMQRVLMDAPTIIPADPVKESGHEE